MNSFKSFYLFALFLGGNIGLCFAHALYIDTNSEGKPGEVHNVNIYYSEFADKTHEKVADWYSDAADLELWLVQPNGTRVLLETQVKNDHLSASFVPNEKGIYRLEISHTTADVAEGTAYQFNAFAQVSVGNSGKTAPIGTKSPDLVLVQQLPANNGQTKAFTTYFKGEVKEEVSATLFLPSGETKTLESNAEGIIEFSSNEEGIHFLEATTYHKSEAGKTKKETYQAIWRAATQKIVL